MTLSLSNEGTNCGRDITKHFARFRALLAKEGIKDLRYFWTKEFQRNGTRHIHLLYAYDEDIWQETLKELWQLATRNTGQHADVHQVDDIKSPAGYVAKYITKNVGHKFDSQERRYGFSRHAEFRDTTVSPVLCYEFRRVKPGINDFRPLSKFTFEIGEFE